MMLLEQADAYSSAGRYEDAIRAAGRYVTLHPDSSRGYYHLGYAQLRSSSRDDDFKSLESLQTAVELSPDNPYGWMLLSSAQARVGKWEEAFDSVKTAVKIAPNLADSHLYYAWRLREYVNSMVRSGAKIDRARRLAGVLRSPVRADQVDRCSRGRKVCVATGCLSLHHRGFGARRRVQRPQGERAPGGR